MQEFKQMVGQLLGAVLRLVLWGLTATVALVLLLLALTLLLFGTLWALVRGRAYQPSPGVVWMRRYSETRFRRDRSEQAMSEVVDVEAREVDRLPDRDRS